VLFRAGRGLSDDGPSVEGRRCGRGGGGGTGIGAEQYRENSGPFERVTLDGRRNRIVPRGTHRTPRADSKPRLRVRTTRSDPSVHGNQLRNSRRNVRETRPRVRIEFFQYAPPPPSSSSTVARPV